MSARTCARAIGSLTAWRARRMPSNGTYRNDAVPAWPVRSLSLISATHCRRLIADLGLATTTATASPGRPPAVDHQRRSRHVARRARRRQEQHGAIVIIVARHAAERRSPHVLGDERSRMPRLLNAAGHEGVDANPERGAVLGQPAREIENA